MTPSAAPRAELSDFAPRIATIRIDPEKIGAVIGKGGETIRGMEAEFECTIDVAEDGLIKVFATDGKLGDGCIERIGLLTRETQVGDIVEGRVASTTSFGAFVTLKPGTDGLVHISRLADHRVNVVEDVVNRGDLVRVEVLEVQMQGGKEKISLRLLENLSEQGRLVSAAEYRLETLPNGQRLVTEKLDHLRSVCLGFWIPAGSRDEPGRLEGATHFLEHLLFKGSSKYTAEEIAQVFDTLGGELNASTSREYVVVYGRFLDDQLPTAMDVMADMLITPTFSDLDREREVILEEIAMVEDSPQDLIHDVLAEVVLDGHPLAHPILGTAQTITDASEEDIRELSRPALPVQRHGGGRGRQRVARGDPRASSRAAGDLQRRGAPEGVRQAGDDAVPPLRGERDRADACLPRRRRAGP